MLKMNTEDGKWYIKYQERGWDRLAIFDNAYDAWCFIFLMREIRPRVPYIRPLYPVRSLNPIPERRLKNVRVHT